VATDPGQVTDAVVQKPDGGWLGGITSSLEVALTVSMPSCERGFVAKTL
jgi:hypothetical protein